MKNILMKILTVGIFLISLIIRTTNLDRSPASINWDEASLGYNAYSILKTGKDEYEKFLPLSLRSFSDFKPALYAYADIPFIYFMGLSQSSTRMASAFWGTISLIGVWLMIDIFVNNYWLRVFSFFIIAMEPWRLHYSRIALETNLSASIFIFGSYLLLSARKKRDYVWRRVCLAILILAISAYAYHSARLVGPILISLFFLDPLGWLLKMPKINISNKFKYLFFNLLFIVLIAPIFLESKSGDVLARFNSENFFKRYYPYVSREIFDGSLRSWILCFPGYNLLGMLTGRLTTYLSPVNYSTNLFHWIKNSVQYVSEFNVFGWMEIFFLIFGMMVMFKKLQIFKYRYLIYWITAAASPTIITWNWFHTLRFLNGIPALEIIIVVGIISFLNLAIDKYLKIIITIFLLLLFAWQSIYIVNNELNYSVWENNGEFQPGGFKEGVPILMKLLPNYDKVIVESPHAQSYIFFLFYSSYDPVRIQSYAKDRIKPGGIGTGSFRFDKFEFRKVNWDEDRYLKKTLIWMPSIINRDQVEKLDNSKVYFFKNPANGYNSSMLISLD